jgi:hypothetical protein
MLIRDESMSRDSVLFSPIRINVFATAWQIGASRRTLTAIFATLSLLALLSMIIPQMPGEIAADPASATRWLIANTQERGIIQRIIGSLGLFQIYSSVIWRGLCGLLFACLSVHVADELPARRRLWQGKFDTALSITRVTEIKGILTAAVAETLWGELLAYARTMPMTGDDGDFTSVVQRGRAGVWAKPMAQIGGILLLTGLWISGQMAWHESGLSLSPEREARLIHRPDLAMRWIASQPPRLELHSPEGKSELSIGWLRPAYQEGIGFYLTGQTPAVAITGTDGEGQPLQMQPLSEGSPSAGLTLTFPRAQMENGFIALGQNLMFRLVSFEHLPEDVRRGPAFLVQAFQMGQNEPIFNKFITTDVTIELAKARFQLDLTEVVVLTATYDPGFPLVLVGSMIAWLGCLMGLAMPYRGWYLTFTPARDGFQVTGYVADLGVLPHDPMISSALDALRDHTGMSSRPPYLTALEWAAALTPVGMMAILTASLWWGQWTSGSYWMEWNSQKWLLILTLAALSWHAWRWPKVAIGK